MKMVVLGLSMFLSQVLFAQQLPPVAQQLLSAKDATHWIIKDSVLLQFNTHHTQGLYKIGDVFYLTAVEVKRWPKKFEAIENGYDRDTGEGIGHIFKFNSRGELLASAVLGKGAIYHPGGLDFDGKSLWVPVCEYRPGGNSIMYKVDPHTLAATEAGYTDDAIGALVYNRDRDEITGMNWDARTFYTWRVNAKGIKLKETVVNPHHHIHIQDAKYIGKNLMLASGLRRFNHLQHSIMLGGLQIIDIKNRSSIYSMPVAMWSGKGGSLNNNPFFAEVTDHKLLMYMVPDDNTSYLYKVEVK